MQWMKIWWFDKNKYLWIGIDVDVTNFLHQFILEDQFKFNTNLQKIIGILKETLLIKISLILILYTNDPNIIFVVFFF